MTTMDTRKNAFSHIDFEENVINEKARMNVQTATCYKEVKSDTGFKNNTCTRAYCVSLSTKNALRTI